MVYWARLDGFETAVDAIVSGDIATLRALLRADPSLVHARSSRRHGATLLIYTAANGVEEERQKTPANIVEIARLLLDSGADVNAACDAYGTECRTLDLAATSYHPLKAGVQIELLQLLLDRGASLDVPNLISACLGNCRLKAAEFLASQGAKIDLIGAAGLGDLAKAKELFRAATTEQKHYALMWASEYGRIDVVEFLLANGGSLENYTPDRQTPLHWAIIGGQVETVKLLLRHKAPLDARNKYGGTPLGQAEWSLEHADELERFRKIIEILKAAGAK